MSAEHENKESKDPNEVLKSLLEAPRLFSELQARIASGDMRQPIEIFTELTAPKAEIQISPFSAEMTNEEFMDKIFIPQFKAIYCQFFAQESPNVFTGLSLDDGITISHDTDNKTTLTGGVPQTINGLHRKISNCRLPQNHKLISVLKKNYSDDINLASGQPPYRPKTDQWYLSVEKGLENQENVLIILYGQGVFKVDTRGVYGNLLFEVSQDLAYSLVERLTTSDKSKSIDMFKQIIFYPAFRGQIGTERYKRDFASYEKDYSIRFPVGTLESIQDGSYKSNPNIWSKD